MYICIYMKYCRFEGNEEKKKYHLQVKQEPEKGKGRQFDDG